MTTPIDAADVNAYTDRRQQGVSAVQRVYDLLRHDIVYLKRVPGATISKNEIAELCGVSPTPVREAMLRLAEEGLIEIYPQYYGSLIVVDYQLTDMSGAEAIEHLRNGGASPEFVVVTGRGDESVAVKMMKQGASDYIVKEGEFLEALRAGSEVHEVGCGQTPLFDTQLGVHRSDHCDRFRILHGKVREDDGAHQTEDRRVYADRERECHGRHYREAGALD